MDQSPLSYRRGTFGCMCPACGSGNAAAPPLPCGGCRRDLEHAPDRCLAAGIVVRSAFVHRGAARAMVHRLKYEAAQEVAAVFALRLAVLVPPAATSLVPVPRAPLRVWRYGIDPAVALAAALSRQTGLPVARALRGSPWWPHHAGRGVGARVPPRFRVVEPIGVGAVVVDDVLTTGATMTSAVAALGTVVISGLTATAAGTLWVRDTDPRRRPGEAGWR